MSANSLEDLVEKMYDRERDREVRALISQVRRDTCEVGSAIYDLRASIRRQERERIESSKTRKPRVEKSLTRPADANRFYRIAAALVADNNLPTLQLFGRQETRAGRLQPQTVGL